MDVTCPACAARYIADEQKLRGKTARMRCRACDTVWLVSGPEDKTMSESKRAAVVKRGADRDHRDLFASRPADLGSVKQTLRPAPPDCGGVAARNESSVLFTVDALRGAARVKTPEPEPAPLSSAFIGSDDEGVIDLNALASAAPKVGARSLAPLFSEPPPAAFAADVAASSANDIPMPGGFKLGKRAIAGMAAALVAVVLASVGLAAAFKGEEPVVRAAASMAPITPAVAAVAAPVAPAPAPVVIAPSSNDSSASASASTGDEDAKPVKGKKKKGKKGFSGAKVQSSGVAASTKSSEPLVSKPAPKAADKCGCKGDFNCILRCTAKGS